MNCIIQFVKTTWYSGSNQKIHTSTKFASKYIAYKKYKNCNQCSACFDVWMQSKLVAKTIESVLQENALMDIYVSAKSKKKMSEEE